MTTEKKMLRCEQCGKATPEQPSAKNKRFCSERCRNLWHSLRRKEGLALLRKAEGKANG